MSICLRAFSLSGLGGDVRKLAFTFTCPYGTALLRSPVVEDSVALWNDGIVIDGTAPEGFTFEITVNAEGSSAQFVFPFPNAAGEWTSYTQEAVLTADEGWALQSSLSTISSLGGMLDGSHSASPPSQSLLPPTLLHISFLARCMDTPPPPPPSLAPRRREQVAAETMIWHLSVLDRALEAVAEPAEKVSSFRFVATNVPVYGAREKVKGHTSDDLVHEGPSEASVCYAAAAFRRLRALRGVSLQTFTNALATMDKGRGGEGKSGARFHRAGPFLVKTLSKSEVGVLIRMLSAYEAHLEAHPRSLLCRFLGLFKVPWGARSALLLVMEDALGGGAFPSMERWDLKGSHYGRKAAEEEAAPSALAAAFSLFSSPSKASRRPPIKKDCDVTDPFVVGTLAPDVHAALAADAKFLASFRIMDYSLVVGVLRAASTGGAAAESFDGVPQFSWAGVGDGHGADGTYFLAIIDYLQEYTKLKNLETILRVGVLHQDDPSAVDPDTYQERFVRELSALFVDQAGGPAPAKSDAAPGPAEVQTPSS